METELMSMDYKGGDKYEHSSTDWGITRTKGSEASAVNINNIMKKFKTTGQLTHISANLMEYRDTSGATDLHAMMNIVADAQSDFMHMPAAIRKACNHDVGNFIPYVDNPENLEQCVAWGILPKSALPEAKPVPTAPTPTPVEED